LGARPVFVDVEPETYNIDPAAAAAAVTPRTRAIIPVHLFGQCAEMGPILELARRRGLHVIEDAAQAIGAEQAGRRAGSFGELGCLSFFPSKNLGGFGDGGMIVTNDADLADRCRSLRVHGSQTKQQYRMVGGNFRLDALQAAVLRAKLAHLPDWTQARRRHARRYDQLLGGTAVGTPSVRPHNKMVYNQYVVRVRGRDALQRRLAECGVGTGVYYRRPLHLEECFAGLGYRPGDMPVAEQAASEVLALPIYPELTAEQQDYVVARLLELVEQPLEAREAGS
ncbi:MAG: DegT/DnrJ/EryC1/StrS family aminotransferase, partial [Phycisphaerae bacterium]